MNVKKMVDIHKYVVKHEKQMEFRLPALSKRWRVLTVTIIKQVYCYIGYTSEYEEMSMRCNEEAVVEECRLFRANQPTTMGV